MDKQLYLERLKQLIAIQSFRDQKTITKEQPFGKAINDVFLKMIQFAKEDGMYAKLVNNKTLEISNFEKATTNDIGILGHLDVVPANNLAKWETNPFELTIKEDGYMYGRGVIDDKGPTLLAYQAAVQVIKDNKNNGKNIRIVLGGAEETTWECVKDYFQNRPGFGMAFTPDSSFPVVNGEKGITSCIITFKNIKLTKIKAFQAQTSMNVIPDQASVILDDKQLDYQGVAAHSSLVEKGENAIYKMLNDLFNRHDVLNITKDIEILEPILKIFNNDHYLENLECNISHPHVGKSTSNLYLLEYNDLQKELKIGLSYRLSYGLKSDYLYAKITEKLPMEGHIQKGVVCFEAFYYPPNNQLVQNLLAAYNQVTNQNAKLVCGAGTTYAKAIENCVAFGAGFPGEIRTAHEENERAKIENFEMAYQIYYQAIVNLTNE